MSITTLLVGVAGLVVTLFLLIPERGGVLKEKTQTLRVVFSFTEPYKSKLLTPR